MRQVVAYRLSWIIALVSLSFLAAYSLVARDPAPEDPGRPPGAHLGALAYGEEREREVQAAIAR